MHDGDEMKPVAWMVEGYDGVGSHIRTVVSSKPKPDSWVSITPLYTAPKELSDDEIRQIWLSLPYDPNKAPYIFARAILKKASEK
jgi:hypothetical protein